MIDRPLLLVGLMGAGKSTIGRQLAGRLGLPFIDSDSELEAQFGCSITEIFNDPGEASFRSRERSLICELIDGPACVIATGGGAFANQHVRERAAKKAISIWLDAPVEFLAKRMASSDNRPLLAGNVKEVLADLHEKRRAAYAEADIHLHCGSHQVDELVNMILSLLEHRQGGSTKTS